MIHGGTRRTATATPFVHEGRRATEDHGELQLQHLLSTKGHGGTRRTATATPFVHEEPRRDTENCNCNTFCPRRATEGHGELQLQHLLSTKGHGGPRRTATATLFVHEEPRRDTENCRTATPFVHEGPRRDHGELQLQHFLSTKSHGGTRRTAELQHLLSTKSHGGPRRTATATPFVHEGTRRDTENCNCTTFCPRRDAEGRGERRLQHPLSTKGCGGPRRKPFFVRGGLRRTAF